MHTYTNAHLDLFFALSTTITTIVLLISALLRVEHTLHNRKKGKRNHYCRTTVRAPTDALGAAGRRALVEKSHTYRRTRCLLPPHWAKWVARVAHLHRRAKSAAKRETRRRRGRGAGATCGLRPGQPMQVKTAARDTLGGTFPFTPPSLHLLWRTAARLEVSSHRVPTRPSLNPSLQSPCPP